MNMRKKLLARIKAPAYRFAARVMSAIGLRRLKTAQDIEDYNTAAKRLRNPGFYPSGQWHRWYKVNRQRQRRLSALKQMGGMKINPRDTSMFRGMVR